MDRKLVCPGVELKFPMKTNIEGTSTKSWNPAKKILWNLYVLYYYYYFIIIMSYMSKM